MNELSVLVCTSANMLLLQLSWCIGSSNIYMDNIYEATVVRSSNLTRGIVFLHGFFAITLQIKTSLRLK